MANLISTMADAKTSKGTKLNVLTGILYLTAGKLCPFASAGCKASCLLTAGRGRMSNVMAGRARKTRMFLTDRPAFDAGLRKDLQRLQRKAARLGYRPAVRLDGTSDTGMALQFAREFPAVTFYDYTKDAQRMYAYLDGKYPANYHLTFSRSEAPTDPIATMYILARGGSVAVVFGTKKGEPLPETWDGFPVIDGDETDVRFLDRETYGIPQGQGFVVGLRAKGRAKQDRTGFVVR